MRSRNIKPGFFKNHKLAMFGCQTQLLFVGLWCLADREGRLADIPRRIWAELFPYDPKIDVDAMLNELNQHFITRYEVKGEPYIQIMNFSKHQNPHYKEPPSEIPKPRDHKDSKYVGGGVPEKVRQQVFKRDEFKCKLCNSVTDLTLDHIKPRVLGGSNCIENLQCLCRKCNAAKNNRVISLQRPDVDPRSGQDRRMIDPTLAASSSLIPDSLIPDSPSLIPESPYPAIPIADAFDSVWRLYPKRIGKKEAQRHYNATVKTEAELNNIRLALTKYRAHAASKERQYIQNGSTWFNNWKDWLDFEEGQNGTHDSASTFSYAALARAKREAEKVRTITPPRPLSDRSGDMPDVQAETSTGTGNRRDTS